jgi:uncharacterized protein with HEPN domain
MPRATDWSHDARSAHLARARTKSERNRLIHAYFDIDHDVLWKAATEEIPPLLTALRAISPSD